MNQIQLIEDVAHENAKVYCDHVWRTWLRRLGLFVAVAVALALALAMAAPAQAGDHNTAIRDLIAALEGQPVPVRSWPSLNGEPVGSGNIPVIGWAGQELAHGGRRFGPYLRNEGWHSITGTEFGALYYHGWATAGVLAVAHNYGAEADDWLRANIAATALGSTLRPKTVRMTVYDRRGQRRLFSRSPGAQWNAAWAYASMAGNRQQFPSDTWRPDGPALPDRSSIGPIVSAALGKPYRAPDGPWLRPDGAPVFEWPLRVVQRYRARGGTFGLDSDLRRQLVALVERGDVEGARTACEIIDDYPFARGNSYLFAGGPEVRVTGLRSTMARENKAGYSAAIYLDGVSSWWSHGIYRGGNNDASSGYARWAIEGDRLMLTISGQSTREIDTVPVPMDRLHWLAEWTGDGCEFTDLLAGAGPVVGNPMPPAGTPTRPAETPNDGHDEALRQARAAVRLLERDQLRPRHERKAINRLQAALRALEGGG